MIKFRNITKSFARDADSARVLSRVSGDIARGDKVALSGISGSGKTTLLNILALMDHTYHGELYFDGQLMSKDPNEAMHLRRYRMGFVSECNQLFPLLSVLDNIGYSLSVTGYSKRQQRLFANEMLERLNLSNIGNEKALNLSAELKFSVAIARAVVHRPAILFCDEITTGLGDEEAYRLIELIADLLDEYRITLISATSDPRLLNYCTHCYYLEKGEIKGEKCF
ncbi:ABC transporter ATP-binding protein [Thaumasiovibrio sp. DFM-14]|uniref:ABC transporter ATP-binding protein n=1 Tax=Thaumasiovibrio sp. DFM-14 TaxID=3384792 RepID=UPI0039A0BE2D